MEYIKDFFNFKDNKKYKIAIIILIIIVIFMQTGLSITNKKIRYLTETTNRLNKIIKEKETELANSNKINNINDLISDNSNEKVKENIIDYDKIINKFIDKFKNVSGTENKVYDPNIKEGVKHLIFEAFNLEMTDSQIKAAIKNITSEKFGIEITDSKVSDNKYFKIYLVEENKNN